MNARWALLIGGVKDHDCIPGKFQKDLSSIPPGCISYLVIQRGDLARIDATVHSSPLPFERDAPKVMKFVIAKLTEEASVRTRLLP